MNKQKSFIPNNKYSAHMEKSITEVINLQTVVNDLKEVVRINLSTAHTKINKQESQTMMTDGQIRGRKVIILLDTGTEETNLLSTNFASVHNLTIYKYDEPVSISMVIKR